MSGRGGWPRHSASILTHEGALENSDDRDRPGHPPPTSRKNHKWCGRLSSFPGSLVTLDGDAGWLRLTFGSLLRLSGGISVVPAMWLNGTVGANVGRLCARTWVTASNPEASLMSVGSLKAVPKKLIPIGAPN